MIAPVSSLVFVSLAVAVTHALPTTTTTNSDSPSPVIKSCKIVGHFRQYCYDAEDTWNPEAKDPFGYRPAFICLEQYSRCEFQSSTGYCDWTETPEVIDCVKRIETEFPSPTPQSTSSSSNPDLTISITPATQPSTKPWPVVMPDPDLTKPWPVSAPKCIVTGSHCGSVDEGYMAVIVFTPEDKCFFQNKHLCNAENGDGECRWTSNKKLESCLASVNKDK